MTVLKMKKLKKLFLWHEVLVVIDHNQRRMSEKVYVWEVGGGGQPQFYTVQQCTIIVFR